ncbi:MAG: hypothetical protein EBT78_11560 [Betaproteobacteria bacterium]|nr:hypothetical protein [Betaproteobacteria bacterium]
MKIKTKVHIHFTQYATDDKGKYEVFSIKLDDSAYRSYVGEQEIEIEVPDDFDPRAQQLAVLQAMKQKVMADYQKSVTDINRQISMLTALELTV